MIGDRHIFDVNIFEPASLKRRCAKCWIAELEHRRCWGQRHSHVGVSQRRIQRQTEKLSPIGRTPNRKRIAAARLENAERFADRFVGLRQMKQTEWAYHCIETAIRKFEFFCIANPKLSSREAVSCFCNHSGCYVDADSGKSECCCLARAIARTTTHIEEAHLWDCADGVEQSSGSLGS